MRSEPDAYAGIARWYDTVTAFFLRGPRREMVRLCHDRGIRRVLDVGCGTGVLANSLAAAGLDVVCLDASPAMLAVAATQLPSTVPCLMGATPLPFFEGSFDAVILSLVLHESDEEPEGLLAEALRVAPLCLVLEWRMPERNLDFLSQPLVHAVERLAGKRHYRQFCRFVRNGYVHGTAHRVGAVVTSERPLLAGSMVLATLARTAFLNTSKEMICG